MEMFGQGTVFGVNDLTPLSKAERAYENSGDHGIASITFAPGEIVALDCPFTVEPLVEEDGLFHLDTCKLNSVGDLVS